MIRAFWCQIENVGDKITPYLIRKIFNDEPVISDDPPRWFIAGSIAHHVKNGDIVCGVGSFDVAPVPRFVDAIGVRGPLTAKVLGVECLYGDGGLLLPYYYRPPKTVRKGIGVVPHYVDYALARDMGCPNVIDVRQDVESFVNEISRYELIAASSLHGIVIAEAYGIPAVRISFPTSTSIASFRFKHKDYYLGTDRELPLLVSVDNALAGRCDPPSLDGPRAAGDRLYNALCDYLQRRA